MSNATSAEKLEIEERLIREIALRREGKSYSEIAAEVGVNKTTAYRDVRRELKRLAAGNDASTAEWREVELAKLDDYEKAALAVLERKHITLYQGVPVRIADDPEAKPIDVIDDAPVLNAVTTLLRIAERRSRLLGLDEPTKTQVSGDEGAPMKIVVEHVGRDEWKGT